MNDYSEIRERMLSATADHKLTILHNDGLYRHIRFKNPKSIFYWFDLITWPGVLVFKGDMGCYVFSRLDDMFEFFTGPTINPGYWGGSHNIPVYFIKSFLYYI